MIEEVVTYIVKQLCINEEAVNVKSYEDGDATIIAVELDKADMGRVIGRGGRVASSIRNIVKSIASKERKKYVVKFSEIDG